MYILKEDVYLYVQSNWAQTAMFKIGDQFVVQDFFRNGANEFIRLLVAVADNDIGGVVTIMGNQLQWFVKST